MRSRIAPLIPSIGTFALQLIALANASADAFPPLKSASGGVLFLATLLANSHANKKEMENFVQYMIESLAAVIVLVSESVPLSPESSLGGHSATDVMPADGHSTSFQLSHTSGSVAPPPPTVNEVSITSITVTQNASATLNPERGSSQASTSLTPPLTNVTPSRCSTSSTLQTDLPNPINIEESATKLQQVIEEIRQEAESYLKRGKFEHLFHFIVNPGEINEWRNKLDQALKVFDLRSRIAQQKTFVTLLSGSAKVVGRLQRLTGIITEVRKLAVEVNVAVDGVRDEVRVVDQRVVAVTEDIAEVQQGVNEVARDVTQVSVGVHEMVSYQTSMMLDLLKVSGNAGLDSQRACFGDTRQAIRDEITSFIRFGPKGAAEARTYLLTGHAGSGKTAIAHTISHCCHQNGMLLASFFFDREVDGRNTAERIFSTMAVNLSSSDAQVADAISKAIERDRSLVTGSLEHQFEELILKPCQLLAGSKPLVIVIDALDEGYNDNLLAIIKRFRELPPNITTFITSREDQAILQQIQPERNHIKIRNIQLDDPNNRKDIHTFIQHRLQEIVQSESTQRQLDNRLVIRLVDASQGLFLWVVTVCNTLRGAISPLHTLEDIFNGATNAPASIRMNHLYDSIMEQCPWNDPHFSSNFNRVIATIIALRTPVDASSLTSLLDLEFSITNLLRSLGALLTGLGPGGGVIRFAHQSFRDYLIDPQASDHSEQKSRRHQTDVAIPEVFVYASSHWQDHLMAVKEPQEQLLRAVRDFVRRDMEKWLDCTPSLGMYESFLSLSKWTEIHVLDIWNGVAMSELLLRIMKLSAALSKVDRDEEALDCLLDASTLRKHGGFDMSLGSVDASIHFASLLNMLVSVVDSRDKAFEACQEVVAILRPLASQCPTGHEHSKELSRALYKLAACHADRRQFDAALEVFQEASNLRGDLPAGGSVANSLHALAVTLANLGRYSEALGVISECVGVRRNIYADDPTEGRPFVASLNTYSHVLSELGGLRESVDIIQEAIDTLQVIASTDPRDSRSLLATCYVTKGHRYRQMEQYAPALEAYQAGLDLRQVLSSDDPDEITKICTALTGISISQMRLGQYEEAIHSSEQAVDHLRTLDDILPGVYAHELATALSDLAHVLHATGREVEALAACREAATLYERLAVDVEDLVYQEHYSSCLSNLSVYLGQQGSYQEAYEASEKAVSIKRMLTSSSASVDRTDVAKAISMMANHLQHLGGREEEAVGALLEANEIFREASQADPSNLRHLATGLNNFNVMLMKMGEAEEGFSAIQEAIHIYRDLFHDQPQIHESHLANSLFNYTVDCVNYGERENALASLNEALAIRRELAHRWPAAHLSTFVNLIQKAKQFFEMMGQPETNEQLEEELAILLSSS